MACRQALLLHPCIGRRVWHVFVKPDEIEKFKDRPVERVDPGDRLVRIVAVIVPGAVRRQNDIAALGFAALAFHGGITTLA